MIKVNFVKNLMQGGKPVIVYVHTYALTSGIMCFMATVDDDKMIALKPRGQYINYYGKNDYSLTWEATRKAVIAKRDKKILSLRKQLDKLETMVLPMEAPKDASI